VNSLEDVQARWAARAPGFSQQQLATFHQRCEGFLVDPEHLKTTGTWNEWLNKAVDANYPAAIAQKALLDADSISESTMPDSSARVEAEAQARNVALSAAASGDPDAIFFMSDWVRAGDRTMDETATIINAWKVLACQKGYDCGPDSNWMITVCNWDVQCTDGTTYMDYLEQHMGSQYSETLRIAAVIDHAIAAKDIQALQSYL
jgi:hypothetical protein